LHSASVDALFLIEVAHDLEDLGYDLRRQAVSRSA